MARIDLCKGVLGVFLFTGCSLSFAFGSAPSDRYLDLLERAISSSRAGLPQITASAEEAAKRVLAGGTLWMSGQQKDLILEACSRAGGLMGIRQLGEGTPDAKDVVLYGVAGKALTGKEESLVRKWTESGTCVIIFSAAAKSVPAGILVGNCTGGSEGLPARSAKNGKIYPVDTVANAVNLWTWTGEFVAACTQGGKMPVLYMSYGLPGARERAKKYKGKLFHDDLAIKPIGPGVLGRAYLDQIQGMLKSVRKNEMKKIFQAAEWWRSSRDRHPLAPVVGHMFPIHFQDPRAPQMIEFLPEWQDQLLKESLTPEQFVLYVGYQYAPKILVDQAVASKFKLVYFSVQSTKPSEPAGNVRYINPYWPLADGCVAVSNYDCPILPASGVIDAAIYWATLAQTLEK